MDVIVKFIEPKICTFLKRYKRFFADFYWDNKIITAHCINTGPMTGLLGKNNLSIVTPKSTGKLLFTWEAVQDNNIWIGVNTTVPNKLIKNYLSILFPDEIFRSEVTFPGFRADFASDTKIIEVKNVHWVPENGGEYAYFPDTVTTRGTKQLLAMRNINLKKYIIYIVQRSDVKGVKIAKEVDPKYYEALNTLDCTVLAFNCKVSIDGVELYHQVDYDAS